MTDTVWLFSENFFVIYVIFKFISNVICQTLRLLSLRPAFDIFKWEAIRRTSSFYDCPQQVAKSRPLRMVRT